MVFKRYADDFKTEITVDDKGREVKTPVYRGNYFEIDLDSKGISQFKRNSILLTGLIALLHISGGFANNTGMNQFYVAIPYVLAFFPLIYTAAGALRLPDSKRLFRRDEIGLSFNRMKTSNIILIVMIGAGIMGELFYIVSGIRDRNIVKELLSLIPELLTILSAYCLMRIQAKIRISQRDADTKPAP